MASKATGSLDSPATGIRTAGDRMDPSIPASTDHERRHRQLMAKAVNCHEAGRGTVGGIFVLPSAIERR
jgi:hypothetical protein